MAAVHIIPTLDTIYHNQSYFKNIDMTIMNGSRKIGEATIVLMDYHRIREAGERLETVARHIAEDMHLAMNALAKHSLFSCEVLCDTDRMYCRVPIIAYIARLYVYPEYRGKGYGAAFLKMLPEAITNITLSPPLAIAVYISPQTKAQHHNGEVTEMVQKDVKAMRVTMERTFEHAGYIKPSKAIAHKRCMCWTEGSTL